MDIPTNKMADDVMKANGAFMDSAMRIGAQAMKYQGQIAQHNMALFDKWMQAGTKQAAIYEDVKTPADMVAKSGELFSDLGQEVATMVRETVEMQVEVAGSMASAIQDEMTVLVPGMDAKSA
ncbi:MAG: hypothetical protein ACI8PT_001528 [Gammaproteobacteria bacterium]|jgi:hypothetical protein